MNIGQLCATVVAIGMAALPGAALAEPSQLQGDHRRGGLWTARRVSKSHSTVQSSARLLSRAAIDTVKAGRFADATDRTPYVQSFEFDVPEGPLPTGWGSPGAA